jgi:hypothetical protein
MNKVVAYRSHGSMESAMKEVVFLAVQISAVA